MYYSHAQKYMQINAQTANKPDKSNADKAKATDNEANSKIEKKGCCLLQQCINLNIIFIIMEIQKYLFLFPYIRT